MRQGGGIVAEKLLSRQNKVSSPASFSRGLCLAPQGSCSPVIMAV